MATCGDCRFFVPATPQGCFEATAGRQPGEVGDCRHDPPTIAITQSGLPHGRRCELFGAWPHVEATDWCGAFEARCAGGHEARTAPVSQS